MSHVYTPDPTNDPDDITLPDDGDDLDAVSVNVPLEGLADKLAFTQAQLSPVSPPGCRLQVAAAASYSLIPTADQVGATAVGLQPFVSDRIPLYDTTAAKWIARTIEAFASNKLTLSGLTSGKNYDVFAYWTGTAVRLELSAAWTNDTTRADALALDSSDGNWKGMITKSSDPTRLYVGTIRTTSTTTTESSAAKRFVWSMYHRMPLPMRAHEATATVSWAYTGGSWRQANAATANKVEFVLGLGGEMLEAEVQTHVSTTANGSSVGCAVGVDGNNPQTDGLGVWNGLFSAGLGVSVTQLIRGTWRGYVSAGYHDARWLEFANGGGATFHGIASAGSSVSKSGLSASIRG